MPVRTSSILLPTLLFTLAAATALAQAVPNAATYQGKLTDSSGQSVADGPHQVQFKLYAAPAEGTPFWTSSTKTVQTLGGLFATQIEPLTAADLGDHAEVWLEVVLGDPGVPLSPRTRLYATPFALRAEALSLPFSGAVSSSSPALSITNTGAGPAGRFLGLVETSGFKLTTSPGAGKVLTSDAEGVGLWQELPGYMAGPGLSLTDRTFSIADGGVSGAMLADGAVTSSKIEDATILLTDLGQNGASAGQVLKYDGTAWAPAADSDTTYAAGTGLALAGNTLSVATAGIDTSLLADAAVTAAKLAAGSVDGSKILDGSIQLADLGAGGAEANNVIKRDPSNTAWIVAPDNDATYTPGDGLELSFGTFSIAPLGIATGMLADNSVTGGKMGSPLSLTGSVAAEDGVVAVTNSGSGHALKANAGTGSALVAYSESGTAGIFDQGTSNTNPALTAIGRNNADKIAIKSEGEVRVVYPNAEGGAANRAMPIAYGYVNADGTKASGTPNFTCAANVDAQRYDITITKYDGTTENYTAGNHITVVTPVTAGAVTPNFAVTGAADGKLFVEIWSALGYRLQGAFQFVVYKP